MESEVCKLPGTGSSSSQTLCLDLLPETVLIRISDRLRKMFPPDLAQCNNLQNHVNWKYQSLVEYKKQKDGNNIQLSGSLAELLSIDFVERKDNGKPLCESDMDYLVICDPRPVHTTTEQPSAGLELDTSKCSSGYTRIQDISSGEYKLSPTTTVGQPSNEIPSNFLYNEDHVPCYRCSRWDVSISSLLNKQTSQAWPTTQQLEELEAIPILLVHKIDPDRNHEDHRQYFRFSFSLVEKFLCLSLPHCFRYIYLNTKLIIKYFCAETDLRSYYIKTTLFHFLVEHYNDQERFSDLPSLGVIMLIKKLQGSFIEGHLWNFFVPEMNLIKEVEDSKRKEIVAILGDILLQLEIKMSDLNKAVTVQDYRKLDQALRDADQARDMMAEALNHENQERTVLLYQAIELLENGSRKAGPNFRMISCSLIHAYLFCEETEKAAEILDSLNKTFLDPDRRIEVLKLDTRHSQLYSSTTSHALCQITQPVYLPSFEYKWYVESMYFRQTNSGDNVPRRRQQLQGCVEYCYKYLGPPLNVFRNKKNRQKLYDFCVLALYVDMLEHLDSQCTNEAREEYEQFTRYLNDSPHQSSDEELSSEGESSLIRQASTDGEIRSDRCLFEFAADGEEESSSCCRCCVM